MAKRTNHTIGLDIGTSKVTCIVGGPSEEGIVEILGIGESESRGLRKGVIVNPDAAVEAIKRAVEEAERMSGVQAEEVTINLAGSHIMGFNGQAIVAVASRDREITADDVRRAIDSACAIQLPAGREIVDRLPQEFIVDDQRNTVPRWSTSAPRQPACASINVAQCNTRRSFRSADRTLPTTSLLACALQFRRLSASSARLAVLRAHR